MVTIDLRMYRMSGIGRYLRNLIPLVLPLIQSKRIRVIGDPVELRMQGWSGDSRIEVFASSAGVYGFQEQALVWSGAFRDTDLLWVPHYSAPLLYSGKLAVTIHDVCHLALPESLKNTVERMYARVLFWSVARKADAIFCVSEFTAREVQRYLNVPESKIKVTYLGRDAKWDTRVSPHVEDDGVPYFLFVGNVKPNKNLIVLLKAFREVIERIPHRLVIVGRTAEMKTVDGNVMKETAGLGNRVHFTGEISDEELMRYYQGAEALVFPSLYEGFGLPLLEAMSSGCPVLCSNASSLPEVGGDAVLYFDPRSTANLAAELLRFAQTPEMRSQLVELGRSRLEMFSYEVCAQQTATVLNKLLAEPRNK